MLPISPGRLGRVGDSRVVPRPSVTLTGISTTDSARTQVSVDTKVGLILGGSITRIPGGNETEIAVVVALWRSGTSSDGDFIERFEVALEPSGDEAGQASFSFEIPMEYSNPSTNAFWFTVRNKTSSNEDYKVHFDVVSLVV